MVPRDSVRVVSPVTGTVTVATYEGRSPWGGYEPVVVVRSAHHPAEWHVVAHVGRIAVRPGQQVREGDTLGWGSSVREGAPHVHWEIRRGRWWPRYGQGERPYDSAVDPAEWLAEREGIDPFDQDEGAEQAEHQGTQDG